MNMTIRESDIRELVQDITVSIHHIAGLFNIAEIFTKEVKYIDTFTQESVFKYIYRRCVGLCMIRI